MAKVPLAAAERAITPGGEMNIKKLLAILPAILVMAAFSATYGTAYAEAPSSLMAYAGGTSSVASISASNYGTYTGTALWVNCGVDISEPGEGDTAQFFLCKNDGDEINQALQKGVECKAEDVPGSDDPMALRSEKRESGLLIESGLEAGDYFIGCKVQSGEDAVYAYQPFKVFPTAAEYARAGLDKIVKSYQNNWFMLRGKYVGLGKSTDDFGNDWEAWIFPALGSRYLLDDVEVDFAIDGAFLSSYDGLTYLDQLKKTLDSYKNRGVLEEQGTKQLFKWIAAVTACGKDPRDFEGYNLVELMMHYVYNDDGTPALDRDGMLCVPAHLGIRDDILFLSYELLGLEIAGATPAEGYTDAVRKGGIRKILSVYGADRVTDGTRIASDWYSMAMLPLMFLKTDGVYGDACVRALDNYKAIVCGSYTGSNGAMTYSAVTGDDDVWSLPNADTESVAINTLVAQGLTAESFELADYQKRYGTLLTALCGDIVDNGVLYGSEPNRMATYQTLGALVDLHNGKSCFEIARDKYRQNYPSYFGEGCGKLSVTDISRVLDQAYSGRAITPAVKVTGAAYSPFGDLKKTLVEGVDYTIEYKNNIVPGKASIVVIGTGDYRGTRTASFNILKMKQPMRASAKSVKVKAKKLKKKSLIVDAKKALAVSNAEGRVTCKLTKVGAKRKLLKQAKKKIKMAGDGKIKLKKGLKKGAYTLKVSVTAEGTPLYSSGSKSITVKIKVR